MEAATTLAAGSLLTSNVLAESLACLLFWLQSVVGRALLGCKGQKAAAAGGGGLVPDLLSLALLPWASR